VVSSSWSPALYSAAHKCWKVRGGLPTGIARGYSELDGRRSACPSRKSYPHIAMVQPRKNWRGDDRSIPLSGR
jgi:hypothetical protein